jgi:arylsulfatase A-like enzyme
LRRPFLALLGAVTLGCPGRATEVAYDLARRLPVAERWSPRDVVLFGTPAAEPHLAAGLDPEPAAGYAWSRGESELSLQWAAPRPRAAVLEVAPYPTLAAQSVVVTLNGTPVGAMALAGGRQRHRLELPAAAQRAGDNRLRFRFAATASPGNGDHRQLAAAFHALTVGAAEDATLLDLLRRQAPAPFAVAEEAGVPRLDQVAPSVVRYALRLPRAAELRFTPRLHPAASGSAVSLRVTAEGEDGREAELWSRTLDPRAARGAPEEVRVPLPGPAGGLVRLGLHAGGAGDARLAWASWVAPRVMGAEGSPPLSAPASRDPGRAASVRQALGDTTSVMLVVLDAARAQQLGCYGYPRETTPEIDRIAREGILFERAYTPAVYTLGAMASVWTSQYPDRHHADVSYHDRLPADRLTLSEALSARGVHAAGFVANPMAGTAFGFDRGFVEFKEVFTWYPELGSRGEAFARILPSWLAKHTRAPFFAYLHFREPHFPYDPPAPFATLFGPDAPLTLEQRRGREWYQAVNAGTARPTAEETAHLVRLYDGNLAYADRQVGALRRALEAHGLWDKTVFIVTADHGEQLYERGYISHSAQVLEQSTRVPLIVRLPAGTGPRGVRIPALVDHLDLAPTVLDVLGGMDGPAGKAFQGRSLLETALGAPGKPAVLSRTVWDRPVYALRDERHKLIFDTRTGRAQLYDLQADPGETRDLSGAQPLRAAYYRQELQHWVAGLLARPAERTGAGRLTREQCENMRGLGYVVADCD